MIEVELIGHLGTDLTVVNAARVSFHKESQFLDNGRLSDRDVNLIKYLARHGHWTPFAHPQIMLRVTAPVFVRSQLFKHKVGLVENEVSRRYVDEEPTFFKPMDWRARAKKKKQGSSTEIVESITLEELFKGSDGVSRGVGDTVDPDVVARTVYDVARHVYDMFIDAGICPEQARMVLPQAMQTEWYWTGSLAAFARVALLRLDSHAQEETRDVAEKIDVIGRGLFPVSWHYLVREPMLENDPEPVSVGL